ncbi:hypothetical protein FKW77_003444 [Venturia effusa]|uniref:protein-tyrosine-phosphatase n=1 Tax=Venturia effusa TaxID=50376 RepID=A0A517L558_9PEZI|nr:hypothetical protein FKW77_003444 [Venturia effusa]
MSYKTISKIQPGLFLSGYEPAYDEAVVRKCGITHIVKVALESTFKGVTPKRNFDINGYLHIEIRDRSYERMYPYFHQIARFINDAHANGGVVLVHCQMGVSRSATAVLAHLMINKGHKLARASEIVADGRRIVNPKWNFVLELRMLERDLFGGENFDLHCRISNDDQGHTYALDWKYSLRELQDGWLDQEDFTTDITKRSYGLNTGLYRLVRDKLLEAARTDITSGEAESHLREVICAWFRLQHHSQRERAMLFRILWRALLEHNDMSPTKLSIMLDAIFTSHEYQLFV